MVKIYTKERVEVQVYFIVSGEFSLMMIKDKKQTLMTHRLTLKYNTPYCPNNNISLTVRTMTHLNYLKRTRLLKNPKELASLKERSRK
jgi:uncharacterized protein YlbG (UPF0298 family)